VIAASADAHSSIKSAADVMDVEILLIKPNQDGSLQQDAAAAAIDKYHSENPSHQVFALVATAGTTNLGIIDDLEGLARCAKSRDIWFHVDGAYGLAALCAPSVRPLFNGIELADSLIVDPHKWLFAPFDACALIYRNPKLAKAAHLQKAAYLETLDDEDEWNPSDYAIHLTRRARGLPFWFSLAAHGTDEYAKAMERTMEVARDAAEQVRNHKNLKLVIEPSLSIVAFERVGWERADYEKWSDQLLADQIGFVTPSAHKGKPILRFAIVNPWTKESDISAILATL
jgi:glutamate/tyrosine decarboxylase-like PLP-dependent enzyme